MTDLMNIIKGRRSVRNYLDKEISEEALNQILESVKWSPSWANTQCWEIIVIRDPKVKEKVQAILPKSNPATKHFGEAPVVLALCGKLASSGYYKGEVTTRFGDWFMFDLGIAAQNICLTAYDLGIGEGYDLVSLIPMGYPTKESGAPKRREVSEFVHYDKF